MNTSPAGQAFIQGFEDRALKAYPDPKSGGPPWTCGWGCTEGVTPHTVWTPEECDRQFALALAKREAMVAHYVKVPLTQGQFDALVSIFYNVGEGSHDKDGIGRLKNGQPSTLLRKLNAGDYAGAADEFPKWCSPGTNVTNGLTRRRNAERAMFLGETP